METLSLLAMFALGLAILFASSWWLDRHDRAQRKMMRRMTTHFDVLAITIGTALVPAFQDAARAVSEFAAAFDRSDAEGAN